MATVRWDDLVCAACSGRVGDGNCPTCRAARERLGGALPSGPVLLVVLVALLLLVALL